MDIDFTETTFLNDPCERVLHADYQQFLLSLTGVTVIDITGENENEWRVISTLLHGDEPSGLIAIHRWLTNDGDLPKPKSNIRIILSSVEAATYKKLFSHRYLPDGVDLNRCFNKNKSFLPQNTDTKNLQGYQDRAQLIIQLIKEVKPTAIIDLHNTSGNGPAFAISPLISPNVLSLTSYFCDTVILSDLNIGGLMEVDFHCPFVTIECGGKNDDQSHEMAYNGIIKFSQFNNNYTLPQDKAVQILYKPLRLVVKPGRKLSFSQYDENNSGVTLRENIEQFNYGGCCEGLLLGWLDDKGLENLEMLDDQGNNVIGNYFKTNENKLICANNLKIFMASKHKDIAHNDCLFYVMNSVNNHL